VLQIRLMDLNNDGTQELVVFEIVEDDGDEFCDRAEMVLIATIADGQAHAFSPYTQHRWTHSLACTRTNEIRFFVEEDIGALAEVFFDWESFSMQWHSHFSPDTWSHSGGYIGLRNNLVSFAQFQRRWNQRFRNLETIESLALDIVHQNAITIGTYEETKTQFFAQLTVLAPDDLLYAAPIADLVAAAQPLPVPRPPWDPIRRLSLAFEQNPNETLLFGAMTALLWATTMVVPLLLQRRRYKRKLERSTP